MGPVLVEGAKVMAKGQITLPKDIRGRLGVEEGDRVALVWDKDRVIMMNSALFAMRALQAQTRDTAAEAGFASQDDVADYITSLRRQSKP